MRTSGLQRRVHRAGPLASWWYRPPAVSRMPQVSRLFSALFAGVGVLVISSTAMPAASGARVTWLVQLLDVVAIVSAAGLLLLGPRLTPWMQHVAIQGGIAMVTGALLASGGGSTAMAYASCYLVPLYAFFVFTPRAATLHLVVAALVGVPSLAAQPGVGAGEQLVLWGVVVMQCVVIVWLVRALAEAETDFVTGLLNRRGVQRALARLLTGRPTDRPLSLVLLNLDHFKTFNDEHGLVAGDRLLAATGAAWAPKVPEGALLARWGGDDFALVLPGVGPDQATALADALRAALPVGTCSAGSAAWEAGESPSMLLARTEAAVYVAKHQGRDRTHQHPGAGSEGRALRAALERGEFVVHFQPIVEMEHGRAVGAEALVRWQHPELGVVPPGEFLPEAERSGVVVDLGGFVLQEACRQAALWPAGQCGNPLYLSVNASGRELQDPGYGARVERALAASGLAPQHLLIELVENDYDVASLHLLANLHRLRALGVTFAIDDFGVGHSSLDRVRRLGVDVLKIDRSFVSGITRADQEEPLVLAMLAMASALRLRVVAEGVETLAQAEWLRRHGCHSAQGYLFGRPGPSAPVSSTLRRAEADSH